MTKKEAAAYLASKGFVPGESSTAEEKFSDPELRRCLKKACKVLVVADPVLPDADAELQSPPAPKRAAKKAAKKE